MDEEKSNSSNEKEGTVSKIQPKSKEIVISRIISEQDISRFNELAPLTITFNNIYDQSSNVISKLNKNVTIRILGGFDEKTSSEFANEKYISRTSYSPSEAAQVIESLNKVSEEIEPDWSDLEKATYSYLYLIRNLPSKYNSEEKANSDDDERPLIKLLKGKANSSDYAYIYQELVEKMGVPCRYIQNENGDSWNEILIDGTYYPLDLFADVKENEISIKEGSFTLKNFLSDKEFYSKKEHLVNEKEKETAALDHSKIQDAIDEVLGKNKIVIPDIQIKSEELKKALNVEELKSEDDYSSVKEIRLDLTGTDTDSLRDDLLEISKYYPNILESVTLANSTGKHVDMQSIIDTVCEAKKNKSGKITSKSDLIIESSLAEDFNIDLSNAPETEIDESVKHEDIDYSQRVTFKNTGTDVIKLDQVSGQISENIDTIRIENFDVSNFNISPNSTTNGNGLRRLELVGGNTKGIADLVGLDKIASLTMHKLNDSEFNAILAMAISSPNVMPALFELGIENQNLKGRHIFSEIHNPNIVSLDIFNSGLDNIEGFESIKSQLYSLSVGYNDLEIDDLRKLYEYKKENPIYQCRPYNSKKLYQKADSLTTPVMTDETFNYLDSYFRRSGYEDYRNLNYNTESTLDDKKRAMIKNFTYQSMHNVPYFIEDAQLFRQEFPYSYNSMMIKDLATFQNYLNDPNDFFEQPYLKDGNLLLTKEQILELINSGKHIPQEITIKINTVADLSNAELQTIEDECTRLGLNLNGVKVFDDRIKDPTVSNQRCFDEKDTHIETYRLDEFKKINQSIEEIVDGITPDMTDAEKFAVVYQRLSQKIAQYDYSAIGKLYTKNSAIYQYGTYYTSRNLSEGLIEQEGFDKTTDSVDPTIGNRAVCAGYADILKNSLAKVGVEAILDSGNCTYNTNTNNYSDGHEWNKVKIDGNWYYADLCWDAGKTSYRYALKGSKNFVQGIKTTKSTGQVVYENGHYSRVKPGERDENVGLDDFDQAKIKQLLDDAARGDLPKQKDIIIEADPDLVFKPQPIDIEKIKKEYIDKKNDMLAKYYGDKSYQEAYEEAAARYRAAEEEIDNGTIKYRTVNDYPEREEDEKFLLLEDYKDSLERMSKYDAGDTSIYSGSPDEINASYQKDKEYVETRNHTFDQHKNTQKDLATLGKYGETLPYIPKQTGIIKNGFRAVGNVGIFARNLVAPVYRAVGKYVAQPLHRLITGGKDASPYRNNPYHRFVARRDYYKDIAQQNDSANGKNHPIRNYITSNLNAITRAKEGNEKVLNAGQYDIQQNLKEQEIQNMFVSFYDGKKIELENQIVTLEQEILNNGKAPNISEAQRQLALKKALLQDIDRTINTAKTTGKITSIQTDAVSQTQHDIASKEVNTYRVAAIKGVAKLGIKKFVGPKLNEWLLERSQKKVAYQEAYDYTQYKEQIVQDPSTTVPIMESHADLDIEVDDLIAKAKDRTVKLYRSVSGGNQGEIDYTIRGDEICSGIHFQNGTKWGTGFSNNAPLMTDNSWPVSFMDANNNLRDNISFSEIANAVSNGELSEEALSTLTLQVEGRGWVYASELFEGVTKEIKVGEKIIEGAKHTELIPETIKRFRTAYKMEQNQRVIDALNTLNKSGKYAARIDTAHNAAEILRPTSSSAKNNKINPREYDYDDSDFYR